jgi:hypothetical protein
MKRKTNPEQNALPFSEKYINKNLFADHFLETRLKELEHWRNLKGSERAFEEIKSIYERTASHFSDRTNEAQTEHDFIQPVLDILWSEERDGDCYQVQVTIPNVDTRRQPDYAFFSRAEERQSAEPLKGTIEYWQKSSLLGDAKGWHTGLDRSSNNHENPSAQVANYLYRARVKWGILTNGRFWRLYERERSSAGGVYFEISLEHILRTDDLEAFKYFYAFFSRAAVVPTEKGTNFLETVIRGSDEYALEVGERLKESVYDALRLVMDGFFHSNSGLDKNNKGDISLAHQMSLIVLYRLLFIFFAEDRGLLPFTNKHYRTYSLRDLHKGINRKLREEEGVYLSATTVIWNHLLNLFRIIDVGDDRAEIPAYNGGLFSPSKFPLIAYEPQPPHPRWQIGDSWLANVIDMLAYRREHWGRPGSQDVDYRSLAVQHLGTIYEGLLELQPHVAETKLYEHSEDGISVFKPVEGDRGNGRVITAGEIYLVNNKGERKASGSYYTPDFIVEHIVEKTLSPLITKAASAVASRYGEISTATQSLEKSLNLVRPGSKEYLDIRASIEAKKQELLSPYLSITALDPAIGSGHFLVGAADYLSFAIVTDPHILHPDDMGDDEPQSYYKRIVVEKCLYGADINPLAVELAKLSLWLHTVSKRKALSFLDHHLRIGNSLVGANVQELCRPPFETRDGKLKRRESRQSFAGFLSTLTHKHLAYFLDTLFAIENTPTTTAQTERKKERLYRQMDAVRQRFRAVANCWLASAFGLDLSLERYEKCILSLNDEVVFEELRQEKWFLAAQDVADELQFFHWEIEFPEVFFNAAGFKLDGERGFDAVVGNPPYGAIAKDKDKNWVQTTYQTSQYQPDLYVAFMERALSLTRNGGFHSFIVPTSFLTMHYFSSVRSYLLSHSALRELVHFKFPVFDDPTVESAVYVCACEHDAEVRRSSVVQCFEPNSKSEFENRQSVALQIKQIDFEVNEGYDFAFSLAKPGREVVDAMK